MSTPDSGPVTPPEDAFARAVAHLRDLALGAVDERDAALAERDKVYAERAHLVAHLAGLYPSIYSESAEDAPEWGIVYIHTPAGQMSWHIAPRDKPLFARVPRGQSEWDGHTTAVKYERLDALTAATAQALAGSPGLREDQAATLPRVYREQLAVQWPPNQDDPRGPIEADDVSVRADLADARAREVAGRYAS